MTSNLQLMIQAKKSLKGNWGTAAITSFVFMLLLGASGCIFGIGEFIFGGPLTLGYIFFIMAAKSDKENAALERIFDGFKDFSRSLTAFLLMLLYIILWSLLFVIPGIIMAYAYSMTFFILAEDKTISASDALKKSKQIMMGYKFKLFCLQLRFFGWFILCGLTFGILSFWIMPYVSMAVLNFYHDITGKQNDNSCAANDPEPKPNIDESFRMDDNARYSPTAEETNEDLIDENVPGIGVEIIDIDVEIDEPANEEEL